MITIAFGRDIKDLKLIAGFRGKIIRNGCWINLPKIGSMEPEADRSVSVLMTLAKRVICYKMEKGHAIVSHQKLSDNISYSFPHLQPEYVELAVQSLINHNILKGTSGGLQILDKDTVATLSNEYRILSRLSQGKFWALDLSKIDKNIVNSLGMKRRGKMLFIREWFLLLQMFYMSHYFASGAKVSFSAFCSKQIESLVSYYVKDVTSQCNLVQGSISDSGIRSQLNFLSYRGDSGEFLLLRDLTSQTDLVSSRAL